MAVFGTAAAASAFAEILHQRFPWMPLRILGNLSEGISGVAGLPFSNYTGVLIGAARHPGVERECRNSSCSLRYVGIKLGGLDFGIDGT